MNTITESVNAMATATEASEKSVSNTTQTFTEFEFTRQLVENLPQLRVTDRDEEENLDLFCYVNCGPGDSNIVRQCRGVVFNGDSLVMRAFPYTVEFSHRDVNQISQNIEHIFDKCSFYDAYEGALIRMFNFNGKWYTSTHRKLNAFRSKWASRESFGTAFKRALDAEVEYNENLRSRLPESEENLLSRFQATLDPEKQYMFLVLHNDENRIVCASPDRPTLYHVGTFVQGQLVMTEDIGVPYPKQHTFENVNELVNYVSNVDIRNLQGIIVFAPGNTQYKVLNDTYLELFRVRGNEPSIKFRYLQVRMNYQTVSALYHLYPNMRPVFEEYENTLFAIARKIHTSYVDRHIKRRWSTLPNEEYKVDKACHVWHEMDRKNNRVTLNKIIEVLNEQPPTNLNRMIRRYNEEKTKQNLTTDEVQNRNRSNTISSAHDSPNTAPEPDPDCVCETVHI